MKDDAVPAAIAALSDQVTTISVQVSSFGPKLAEIEAQLTQTSAEIMKRLDLLEKSFDEMRDEVKANRYWRD